jgi:hypothetical protein
MKRCDLLAATAEIPEQLAHTVAHSGRGVARPMTCFSHSTAGARRALLRPMQDIVGELLRALACQRRRSNRALEGSLYCSP